jgi:signal transduction histidine kinase/CheY-like chemotaxis protein
MINFTLPKNIDSSKSSSRIRGLGSKARIINIFIFVLIPLFIFSTVYCIIYNYPRIVYTNIFYLIAISIALVCNKKEKYSLAKALFICANCLVVFIYYKLMDNETSMFFYFFPLILCLLLFYKPNEEKLYLNFTIVFVAVCILLTIFLPSTYFSPWPLTVEIHQMVTRVNSIACTFVILIYAYSIFKNNRLTGELLVEAKETAEEATKAKAVFLSTMSHELRTPLNGIVGTANLLASGDLKDVNKQIELIKNLSEHMLGLVNDVLDYSKIESGKLELHSNSFNVKDVIVKLFNTFFYQFDAKGLHYKVNVDSRLQDFNVLSDDLRLQQILYNLIANALKFTAKGSVHVNATLMHSDENTAKVLFDVTDTGIGIAQDKLESIFESFNQVDAAITRKYGGTGLGLSISNDLAKLFNTKLQVESKVGEGSVFSFKIAFPINKKAVIPKFVEPVVISLKDKKILIAEDNPVNMVVAKMMLKKWGVQVTEAVNGKIAFEKCKDNTFDLILLDLEMPEMDGRTALKEIKNMGVKTPIMAFTAGLYDDMDADLKSLGFVSHALKPFKPEALHDQLIEVLKNSNN